MKHLLNVLYVVTEDSYISKQGETVCVHVGGDEKVRVPAHTVESIVCFGHTTVSTPLLGFLGERGIGRKVRTVPCGRPRPTRAPPMTANRADGPRRDQPPNELSHLPRRRTLPLLTCGATTQPRCDRAVSRRLQRLA